MSSDNVPPEPAEPRPHAETPAEHVAAVQKKKNLYLRVTSSMPLLITVIVHVVLIGIAGAVVVQQNIAGKKKTFEASAAENTARPEEHRLQIARRGGASAAASSPVSANRILSTATGALAMPEMPDLPSSTGGFGGFGGMGSGVGMGSGTGMSTSLGGGAGLGGRGFMSLSFLGSTSQNVSKVIFVVDTSTEIMEPRKGGFQAFTIIREEIMRLVGRLPASAQFNVVLFSYDSGDDNNGVATNLFRPELSAATSDNKKAFFEWMTPVNAQLGNFGPDSAGSRNAWKAKPLPENSGVDPLFLPPVWARATHAALEQEPDAIYVITASQGRVRRHVDETTLAKRREANLKKSEQFEADMRKAGLDAKAVIAAKIAAHDKAARELEEINRKLVAQKKDPIVLRWIGDLESAAVQAELRKSGVSLRFDRTGWTNKDGSPINTPDTRLSTVEDVPWTDFQSHYARLQRALAAKRPTLNLFLFVGPDEKAETASQNLTAVAKRNGGTFQLLTTKRLEELKGRDEEKK